MSMWTFPWDSWSDEKYERVKRGDDMTTTPTITNIRRHNGVAGEVSYTADVQYPGEDVGTIEFIGNTIYGGAPVLIMGNGAQVFVRPSGRFIDFGTLNPQWVRDFFKTEETV